MAVKGEPVYYSRLPPPPPPQLNYQQNHHEQSHYIVLPLYYSPLRFNRRLIIIAVLIFIAFSLYLLWPSDPSLNVVRLRLHHIRLRILPVISIDLSLALVLKVRNRDFFSLSYNSLNVSLDYRGRRLGFVTSSNGDLRARGSAYVNATLQLDGIEVIHDAFYFIEDLGKGAIPLDTVTEVEGHLGFFFFKFPLKEKVSCEIDVNPHKQTISRQDCYPEVK